MTRLYHVVKFLSVVIIYVNHISGSYLDLCASGEAYPMPPRCHRRYCRRDAEWIDPASLLELDGCSNIPFLVVVVIGNMY